jgi:HlyD family secretion protein
MRPIPWKAPSIARAAAVVFALLSILLPACKRADGSVAIYETAPVKKGDITQVVTASGTLNALVSVDVGSQISGRIQTLSADFNSKVKKGDVVAEIEPDIYQATVNQCAGEVQSAKAALKLAKITADRKRALVAQKAGTQADADKADADYEQAQATVIIQQALMDRAQADLDHCRIMAPVDGIVISRKVDVGQTVAAAMTTPILYTMAQDITKMHIIASVSEADIGQVAVGQKVDFTVDAFPDEIFHGQVSQVRKSATTTNNVVTYDTVIDVENPEQKLFPGMTAEVSIYVAQRHGILTVSNAALRYAPPDSAKFEHTDATLAKLPRSSRTVYVPVSGATLKVAVVKTGVTDGLNSEVLSGLNEGDLVVTATVPPKNGGPFGGPPPDKQSSSK